MKKALIFSISIGFLFLMGCSSLKEVGWIRNRKGLSYDPDTDLPFTGAVVKYYPNGKIRSRVEYKDGKYHGKYVRWYENGRKDSDWNYRNGKRYGRWYSWDEDGNITAELEFSENDGYYIHYDSDMKSVLKWNNINNPPHNTSHHQLFDLKGNIIAELKTVNRKRTGTSYDDNYNVPFLKHYYKGKLIAHTDLDGNAIDISKLKKKTEEELEAEGKISIIKKIGE